MECKLNITKKPNCSFFNLRVHIFQKFGFLGNKIVSRPWHNFIVQFNTAHCTILEHRKTPCSLSLDQIRMSLKTPSMPGK